MKRDQTTPACFPNNEIVAEPNNVLSFPLPWARPPQLAQPLCITPKIFRDARGSFTKTWHPDLLETHGITMTIAEEFYSVSDLGVLRGMHLQLPPYDYEKLVYCVAGSVLDVLLDLRLGSPTYGQTWSWELSPENGAILYIPKGIAHGFLSLAADSVMVYKTSIVYSPEHDTGVLWDSFGFNWPAQKPTLSERDQKFSSLFDFVSPF